MTANAHDLTGEAGSGDIPALVLGLAGEVLGRDGLGLDDEFFAVGGDSVLAMHLVGRAARATGLRLRVRMLIDNPSLGAFAARVADALDQESAGAATALAHGGPHAP